MKKNANSGEIVLLLRAIDQGYNRSAWHGPNLRGALRGLRAEAAAWRPAPGRHNVRELVAHAAYWKYAVRRRVTDGKRGAFSASGSNWFDRAESVDEKGWRRDLKLLAQEHALLREAIASLDVESLHRRKTVGGRPLIDIALGVAFHDIYHAGQIQLLKRLYQSHGKRQTQPA